MEVAVRVTVWSQQRQKDGDRHTFEVTADGKLYQKGDAFYINYRESEASGLGSTLTTIRLEGEEMTLIRQGETVMRQVLTKGIEQRGSYKTPFGTFELITRTSRLYWNLKETGGQIEALYNLRLSGEKSRMELRISVVPLATDRT
ncbi:DUF1934 domain-containing protein [Tumebacillus lipolyticus]|uniref:DUF1934 domain-containing protein n=1 Tax=Tumebacillus lipolyticus TaxID=1280370 RepID=A0ABW4ZYD4_9BACL